MAYFRIGTGGSVKLTSFTVLSYMSGTSSTYTFGSAYPCAVVAVASIWCDSASCTGNNCSVHGNPSTGRGWDHYGNLDEHIGGMIWFVNDIKVGSQVTWNLINPEGDPGVTILGIGDPL